MIKKYIYIIICWICSFSVFGSPSDSIKSVYADGEFQTHYQKYTTATSGIAKDVAEYLMSDFHNAPEHLFEWALKDLGLQNKSNELIIIFKSSTDDLKTGVTHGVFDIIVPHFTTFNNVKVDAIVSRTRYTNGSIKVTANIIYSSLLLKNAVATIMFIPQKNNHLQLVTDVKINFGWFFNFFITKRRYKSIVEWRIKKFTENIVEECEMRQMLLVKDSK